MTGWQKHEGNLVLILIWICLVAGLYLFVSRCTPAPAVRSSISHRLGVAGSERRKEDGPVGGAAKAVAEQAVARRAILRS